MDSPKLHTVLMAESVPPRLREQVHGEPGGPIRDIDIVDALQRDECRPTQGDAFVHLHEAPQDEEQWATVLRTLGPCTGVLEFVDMFFDTEDGQLRRNNLWYFDRAGEQVLKLNASRNRFDCLFFDAIRDSVAIRRELGKVLGDRVDDLQRIAAIKTRRLMFGPDTVIDVATLPSKKKHVLLRTKFRLSRDREEPPHADEGTTRPQSMRYVNSRVVEYLLDAGKIGCDPSFAPPSKHYARMPRAIKKLWREQLGRIARVPTDEPRLEPVTEEWRQSRERYTADIKPRLAALRAKHGDVWAVFFPDTRDPVCFDSEQEAEEHASQCAHGVPIIKFLGDEPVEDSLLLNKVKCLFDPRRRLFVDV
ncbi:hypothetical protein PTSG_07330 [Salpingoeca rosetta]|uniref:Uncharacterized protein n=1 Tax=Salpingoeca rosetta (strain ATCC 50818 / BSB-021) TaxID=946362 RepID=F2UJ39_SALR5|nr:uncharacterized protein PTSG_07330 [Salpingoeca rosetta]EGD76987.1 hypothetical protein PTSG_07330 [Salpingoeca rosetta]|eukprot:XP_004990827.1 hypothetical protein PTSG_07330 [Salpingoeca rosetta]